MPVRSHGKYSACTARDGVPDAHGVAIALHPVAGVNVIEQELSLLTRPTIYPPFVQLSVGEATAVPAVVVATAEYVTVPTSPGTATTTSGLYCTSPVVHVRVKVVPPGIKEVVLAVQTLCESDGLLTVPPVWHVQVRLMPPLNDGVGVPVPDGKVVAIIIALPAGMSPPGLAAEVQETVEFVVVLAVLQTRTGVARVAHDAVAGNRHSTEASIACH